MCVSVFTHTCTVFYVYSIPWRKLAAFECIYVYIIEYGSTLYVGMTREKNGGPIKCVQNLMSELCSGSSQKLL